MRRNYIIIVVIVLLFLSVVITGFWLLGGWGSKKLSLLEQEKLVDKIELNLSDSFKKKINNEITVLQEKIAKGDKGEAANLGPLYSSLGLRYDSLGYFGLARENFLKAINLDPGESIYWVNLSDTYVRMKAFWHAQDALLKAIAMQNNNESYWIKLLELQIGALNFSESDVRDSFNKALIATRRQQNILSRYASYLESLDFKQEALSYWEELIKKVPDDKWYRQELIRLRSELTK